MDVFELIGRLYPPKYTKKWNKKLKGAGYEIEAERVIGLLTLIKIVFALAFYFSGYLILSFFTLIFPEVIFYLILLLKIDEREKEIEKNLPDFLQLTAANIRAGLTIDQALWFSIKEQYGILAKEMQIVAKKSFSGTSITKALEELKEKYSSKLLRRSLTLIVEGINSGGKIADILEKVAWDIQKTFMMKKEVAANVKMYEMFILFAVVLGSPALFGLSFHLLKIMVSLTPSQNIPSTSINAGITSLSLSKPSISPELFFYFAIASITLTNLSASLLISVISKGKMKEGIKYFPVFLGTSLLIFYAVSKILENMFAVFL